MDGKVKTAIILGATGLTGGILLQLLLGDRRYQKIKLFSRSGIGFEHPKLEEYLGDLMNLATFQNDFKGDVVFCCIGTTKAKTSDKEIYKMIDYGIPVNAAHICKENGIETFLVVSALGANPESTIFYNRIKGQMEKAVLDFQIGKTHILQPSLISGKRKEKRRGEQVFKQLMAAIDFLLVGPLEKYRSVHPETIAKCMIWLANNDMEKIRIESDEIKKIANSG